MKILFPQVIEDTKALALRIPKDTYSYVFGIPAGGLISAYIIAEVLQVPLLTVEQFRDGDFIKDANVLIVDDLVDGGGTIQKFNPKGRYDVAVVYRKEHSPKNLTKYCEKEMPNEWLDFPHEKEETGIEEHIQRILEYIGEDVKRTGLVDTPRRVAKMYKELFRGYSKDFPKVTTFQNGDDGIMYDQMILDEGNFYSHCEHHMVPFFGKYYFAYIPAIKGKIIGLSKVARIVDFYSAKLQVQERLVQDVVNHLWKELSKDSVPPRGMALVMKGEHLCKTMRGAKKQGKMVTAELRGGFKDESKVRDEFYNLISL